MGWEDLVQLVQSGEPVSAGVANRPVRQLEANVRYVKQLLEAAGAGTALFARGVAVEAAAVPGMPVFYNTSTRRYERALLAVTTDPDTGLLVVAESARVAGVVVSKADATTADLVRVGTAALDLTAAAGGNTPGLYYLSSSAPGHLTRTRPAVGVPVLLAEGGTVYVCPQMVDPNNDSLVSAATAVTNLASRDGRVKIYCADTSDEASTGPLELELDLGLAVDPAAERTNRALTRLDAATQTLHWGYVTEGIYAVTPNVHLVSDLEAVSYNPDAPGSAPMYRGRVGISVLAQPSIELDPQLTRLAGTSEEYFSGVMYLGMPQDRPSSFVSKFRVPDVLPYTTPKFVYRLRLIGRAAGTLPALTVTYRRVARPPAGLATPVSLPGSDTPVTITTAAVLASGNKVVEAASSPFAVAAGDAVFVTVTRAGSDGYAAELGRLEELGSVVEGV